LPDYRNLQVKHHLPNICPAPVLPLVSHSGVPTPLARNLFVVIASLLIEVRTFIGVAIQLSRYELIVCSI